MESLIQTLPAEVVHLIAAGEVIDSLAAVVRELAENSLDAGATRVAVSVWPDQWRVRVADNGAGMGLADLRRAATPHSTSKIRDRDDLWKIKSLGFRGEALHSLAQLASLEICSRQASDGAGWRVVYDGDGTAQTPEAVAMAPGTIVTIARLFEIWPARREGLPPLAQQLRAIQRVIQQMALCHPTVTWQVEQRDRPWFSLWPGETAQALIPQMLREVRPGDLQTVTLPVLLEDDLPAGQIEAVVGLPDRCHRRRPDWVCVAMNGRMVRSPELEQAALGAFRRTLPRDRHPVCFLHLQVPPEAIDWNRHPAKAEIYLHQADRWQDCAREAIAQALHLSAAQLPAGHYADRVGSVLKAAEAGGAYHASRTVQPADTPPSLRGLRAIAQVHNMYILAEHPSGVWLVEQHIAHERVLYEELRDRWQTVPLPTPVVLSHLSPAQREQLQRLGLDVDLFGEDLWAVRSAPEPLAARPDCADALIELSLGGDLETALVAVACRTAIRNGTPLSLPEMQTLLDRWQHTQNPRTCPHGRPIYLSLEESSLARFFRRHWVIGKSHGI